MATDPLKWYQITTSFGACFGVGVDEASKRVAKVAPIWKWALGLTWRHVRNFALKKGGKVVELNHEPKD